MCLQLCNLLLPAGPQPHCFLYFCSFRVPLVVILKPIYTHCDEVLWRRPLYKLLLCKCMKGICGSFWIAVGMGGGVKRLVYWCSEKRYNLGGKKGCFILFIPCGFLSWVKFVLLSPVLLDYRPADWTVFVLFFEVFPLLNFVIGCKTFLFRTEINTLSVDVLSSDPCPFLHPFRYSRAQRSTSSQETSPSPARSRRRRFPMAMSTSLTGPRRSTGQSPPSLSWGLLKISTSKWEKVCTGFPKFPT